MHSINRLSFVSLFLLSLLTMFSCGSDDPIDEPPVVTPVPDPNPVQPDKPHSHYLDVRESLLLDYIEDNIEIAVNSDTTYSVSVDCDWLSVDVLPSGYYIKLTYLENKTDDFRTAKLVVKNDAGMEQTVSVMQDFETKIVSTDFKIGNGLLGEENVALVKLNRKVTSVTATLKSLWLQFEMPSVRLLDDKQTVEITGLQGFGSNYTYQFAIEVESGNHHSFQSDIWLSDLHWGIDGRLVESTVRNTKPDYAYAATVFPNRLYGFNSHDGNPYFSLDLDYTPKGIAYCALTDEVYVLGDDVKLHVYDANDGSRHRDIVLPALRNSSSYSHLVITDAGLGLVAGTSADRYMFDASRGDVVYTLPGFDDWGMYREMKPSLGSDGKIWFSTMSRQLFRIESADGPVTQSAYIDGHFNVPDVWGMGGVWATYVWKPGQNKVLISTNPTAQVVFNFDTRQFDFYTMIESRCEGGLAFDVTQPASTDRLWWVRERRFADGTGRDFLITEDRKVIFWSKDTRNSLSMIQNHPDGKTMIVAFEKAEGNQIKTYFEAFDVEKFNAASTFSESYAGW